MWEAIKSPLIEQAMTEDIELCTSFIPAETCSVEGGNRLFQHCLRRFRRRKKWNRTSECMLGFSLMFLIAKGTSELQNIFEMTNA